MRFAASWLALCTALREIRIPDSSFRSSVEREKDSKTMMLRTYVSCYYLPCREYSKTMPRIGYYESSGSERRVSCCHFIKAMMR